MKKLLPLLGLILMMLTGYNKTTDGITITADRNLYTPAMSSVQGITLTPNFNSKKTYSKLIYHWVTPNGEFINVGKEVKNQGEPVVWSTIENDKVVEIKNPFVIKLEVIDSESKKILVHTELKITPNSGFYEIKK